MTSNDPLEGRLQNLRYERSAERRHRTLQRLFDAMDETQVQIPALGFLGTRSLLVSAGAEKLILAAAAIFLVIGGITFWPSGPGRENPWWLGSSAVWGREVLARLDTIEAVSCRERTILVAADGSEHMSSTWDIFYVSSDSYRRDIYDGDVLREIQWYVPEGQDMIQHYVRFDLNCYGAVRHKGSFGVQDPVERMRSHVRHADKANRFLGEKSIEGRECVGFEISAASYGDNPEEWVDRIWFDVETRLPVRMERSGRPVTGRPDETFTTVLDQFVYNGQLPADTFIPTDPPAGFVNAHPDDLRGKE